MFFCCLSMTMGAKEQTATLQIPDGGKVVVRYDEKVDREGAVTISILGVQKKLGAENSNQLDRIRVLFFDKNGGHSEDQFVSKIATEALSVRSDEVTYNRSSDGIVWLDEQPELKLRLHTSASTLFIPVYIARYEKKHKYKILASCGTMTIPISRRDSQESPASATMSKVSRTVTTTEEIEGTADLPDAEIASNLIARIEDMIDQSPADRLPEGIDFYVGQLRELEFSIKDRNVKSRIAETLSKVENKKVEVSDYASRLRRQEGDDAATRAEEKEARRNLEYLNERLANSKDLSENDVAELKSLANEMRRQSHSVSDPGLASDMKSVADRCDEEVKKFDDSKKKKNIWMIIGGVILAILMFVGNLVFRHFRDLNNQKSISDMQEKLAKQAAGEAKRRARGMAYNKMAQTRNAVRGKVTGSVEKGIDNLSKGKGKKVSI